MAEPDAPIWLKYLREIVLLSVAVLSYRGTSPRVRFVLNKFSWGPILEVSVLFLGIFTTMSPALVFMEQHAADLGLIHPWQFYFATGSLSSVLDNTPTAVAFYSLASGLQIAESISPALARNVVSCGVNGETVELNRPINEDANVELYKFEDEQGKHTFWHTSAHLLAEALHELYPGIQFGFGPGFRIGNCSATRASTDFAVNPISRHPANLGLSSSYA